MPKGSRGMKERGEAGRVLQNEEAAESLGLLRSLFFE